MIKSFKSFITEGNAQPMVQPRTRPQTTPSTKPGRPSPYRKDKPSVTPKPKANVEKVAEKFLNLTKNNKEIQSLLKKKYK